MISSIINIRTNLIKKFNEIDIKPHLNRVLDKNGKIFILDTKEDQLLTYRTPFNEKSANALDDDSQSIIWVNN